MRLLLTVSALALLGFLAAPGEGRAAEAPPTKPPGHTFHPTDPCYDLFALHVADDNPGLGGLYRQVICEPNDTGAELNADTCTTGGGCTWKLDEEASRMF